MSQFFQYCSSKDLESKQLTDLVFYSLYTFWSFAIIFLLLSLQCIKLNKIKCFIFVFAKLFFCVCKTKHFNFKENEMGKCEIKIENKIFWRLSFPGNSFEVQMKSFSLRHLKGNRQCLGMEWGKFFGFGLGTLVLSSLTRLCKVARLTWIK